MLIAVCVNNQGATAFLAEAVLERFGEAREDVVVVSHLDSRVKKGDQPRSVTNLILNLEPSTFTFQVVSVLIKTRHFFVLVKTVNDFNIGIECDK